MIVNNFYFTFFISFGSILKTIDLGQIVFVKEKKLTKILIFNMMNGATWAVPLLQAHPIPCVYFSHCIYKKSFHTFMLLVYLPS